MQTGRNEGAQLGKEPTKQTASSVIIEGLGNLNDMAEDRLQRLIALKARIMGQEPVPITKGRPEEKTACTFLTDTNNLIDRQQELLDEISMVLLNLEEVF